MDPPVSVPSARTVAPPPRAGARGASPISSTRITRGAEVLVVGADAQGPFMDGRLSQEHRPRGAQALHHLGVRPRGRGPKSGMRARGRHASRHVEEIFDRYRNAVQGPSVPSPRELARRGRGRFPGLLLEDLVEGVQERVLAGDPLEKLLVRAASEPSRNRVAADGGGDRPQDALHASHSTASHALRPRQFRIRPSRDAILRAS
jgi:hypothetical protein